MPTTSVTAVLPSASRAGRRVSREKSCPSAPDVRGAEAARSARASRSVFPSADEGYTLWHRAHGGVFDIPLAQIIAIVAQQISRPADPVPAT
jgi:hypothetical protein